MKAVEQVLDEAPSWKKVLFQFDSPDSLKAFQLVTDKTVGGKKPAFVRGCCLPSLPLFLPNLHNSKNNDCRAAHRKH